MILLFTVSPTCKNTHTYLLYAFVYTVILDLQEPSELKNETRGSYKSTTFLLTVIYLSTAFNSHKSNAPICNCNRSRSRSSSCNQSRRRHRSRHSSSRSRHSRSRSRTRRSRHTRSDSRSRSRSRSRDR